MTLWRLSYFKFIFCYKVLFSIPLFLRYMVIFGLRFLSKLEFQLSCVVYVLHCGFLDLYIHVVRSKRHMAYPADFRTSLFFIMVAMVSITSCWQGKSNGLKFWLYVVLFSSLLLFCFSSFSLCFSCICGCHGWMCCYGWCGGARGGQNGGGWSTFGVGGEKK